MSGREGAPASASAALLRRLADSCRSVDELGAALAARPFAEVQALLRELACLIEPVAAPVVPWPEKPPRPAAQSSFGFQEGEPAQRPLALSPQAQAASGKPVVPSPKVEAKPAEASPAAASPASAPRKLLLYSDGAARGNPGPSGAGAVLMKPDGTIVARLGKYLGRQTNNHAEYMALIIGLRAALELGVTEIEMVADSELMVKQIKKIYRVKNEHLKALYDEATGLIARFDRASIRHVLREYNREADEMSNRAIDERM